MRSSGRWGAWVVVGTVGLVGCSIDGSGFGEGGGQPANTLGGGMTPATDGDDDDDGTDDSDEVASTGAGMTTSGDDDSADGDTGPGPGPGSSDDGMGLGDTGKPEQELVEHTDFDGCDQPVWCHQAGDIDAPGGGSTWAQECFSTHMDPPFELIQAEFVLRGLAPEVNEVDLQVWERMPGGGPGAPIGSQPLDVSALTIGLNTHMLDSPIIITTQNFCIGLAAPGSGLSGAMGVSVNPGSSQGSMSYIRMQGDGECEILMWTDLFAPQLDPEVLGNWCIRGVISK